MKEKRDCKIVQDLLPNYIEQLTNEETNQFINEHLLECDDCKNVYNKMIKELNTNKKSKIDSTKVNYFKKYNKKLRIFEISTIVLLIAAVSIFVHYTFLYREAYLNTANGLIGALSEYPDTFYATIEEIEDENAIGEFGGLKTIKVKGLDINEKRYRDEFYFDIMLDNIGDNFKIEFEGETIDVEELKVGQTIAVYSYDDGVHLQDDKNYLISVRKITVLNNEL